MLVAAHQQERARDEGNERDVPEGLASTQFCGTSQSDNQIRHWRQMPRISATEPPGQPLTASHAIFRHLTGPRPLRKKHRPLHE